MITRIRTINCGTGNQASRHVAPWEYDITGILHMQTRNHGCERWAKHWLVQILFQNATMYWVGAAISRCAKGGAIVLLCWHEFPAGRGVIESNSDFGIEQHLHRKNTGRNAQICLQPIQSNWERASSSIHVEYRNISSTSY